MKSETALWRISQWFNELDAGRLSLMKAFQQDLLKWNNKINLISPNTMNEADSIHFADCILGFSAILKNQKESAEIFDFGSGNGFPGVIGAMLFPEKKIICVDSDERKIGFIKQFALRTNLKNIETKNQRIESLKPGSVQVAVTRALGSAKQVLERSSLVFAPKSSLFHFKGAQWKTEVDMAVEVLGWETLLLEEYDLPSRTERRVILKSTKF